MNRFLWVSSFLLPIFSMAMPAHPDKDGPHSCVIGPGLDQPKNLRDYTIETCAILVQFSDNLANTIEHLPARYDSMLYSTGVYYGQYRAGSLNDFYLENSYGATNVVGGIAGNQWYMSNYTYSHYYDGYYMLTSGYELAYDAVALVDATVDFHQYDTNNDGHIDGAFIVHAGPGGEDTGDINHCWSHALYLNYQTNDGVIIDGATNVPEINLVTPSLDTTLCCIAVMCHELGHIVGLPDLYDGSRNTWGVGYWSLMGYGAWGAGGNTPWSPSHADAWCKTEVNWLLPIDITSNTFDLAILDAEMHPIAYRVWRGGVSNDTFFIIENRQNKGFDTPLPGKGLLIWHIDPRYYSYDDIVDLEEADGCDDLDSGWGYRPDPHYYHHELGDSGDPYPGDSNNTVFDSLSYPSSDDNWGNPTHVSVRNIVLVGDTIICDIIIDPTAVAENQDADLAVMLTITPNPFCHETRIRFTIHDSRYTIGEANQNISASAGSISENQKPELQIYDAAGRLVKDFFLPTAYCLLPTSVSWDGTDQANRQLPSGIYFVQLHAGERNITGKLLLIR